MKHLYSICQGCPNNNENRDSRPMRLQPCCCNVCVGCIQSARKRYKATMSLKCQRCLAMHSRLPVACRPALLLSKHVHTQATNRMKLWLVEDGCLCAAPGHSEHAKHFTALYGMVHAHGNSYIVNAAASTTQLIGD